MATDSSTPETEEEKRKRQEAAASAPSTTPPSEQTDPPLAPITVPVYPAGTTPPPEPTDDQIAEKQASDTDLYKQVYGSLAGVMQENTPLNHPVVQPNELPADMRLQRFSEDLRRANGDQQLVPPPQDDKQRALLEAVANDPNTSTETRSKALQALGGQTTQLTPPQVGQPLPASAQPQTVTFEHGPDDEHQSFASMLGALGGPGYGVTQPYTHQDFGGIGAAADAQKEAVKHQALVDSVIANDVQPVLEDMAKTGTRTLAEQQAAQQQDTAARQGFTDKAALNTDLANREVDPEHYWHSLSTPQRLLSVIGLLVSGAGAGLNHSPNEAIGMLDKLIAADTNAQLQNREIHNKAADKYMSLAGLAQQTFASRPQQYAFIYNAKAQNSIAMIKAIEGKYADPAITARAEAAIADLDTKRIATLNAAATAETENMQRAASAKHELSGLGLEYQRFVLDRAKLNAGQPYSSLFGGALRAPGGQPLLLPDEVAKPLKNELDSGEYAIRSLDALSSKMRRTSQIPGAEDNAPYTGELQTLIAEMKAVNPALGEQLEKDLPGALSNSANSIAKLQAAADSIHRKLSVTVTNATHNPQYLQTVGGSDALPAGLTKTGQAR